VNPYELIRRKRDGLALDPADLRRLLREYGAGTLPDYQMSAWLMAVYFRGMTREELDAMVGAILASGTVLDLSTIPGPKADKHSTGGVGDKVSLVLAPLAAALGLKVPMMSGRGLGHSGGTLDKLESIPGFRTDIGLDRMREQLAEIGCAMIGPSDAIAPLDRAIYALRDVTATVESVPLIAASIMSKKIAEGAESLVIDLKRGKGGFLPELDHLLELGRTMIEIGADHDRKVSALVTAMDRPLGVAVGNALEVKEALAVLHGDGPDDVREVTLALVAEMLVLAGSAGDRSEALRAAQGALDDGSAAETMERLIEAQGGDPAVVADPSSLPAAAVRREVPAPRAGWVRAVHARPIGQAAVALGAGRRTLEDRIHPGVGFEIHARPGARTAAGDVLAVVHAADRESADAAAVAVLDAIEIGDERGPEPLPLLSHRIDAAGVETLA
jgi:pyrimidine-nucleoside phosphorylase